ncbi:MAG: translation initiation factor IF-2 subunit alpha [Candidatus Woesearchaeota archaeon]
MFYKKKGIPESNEIVLVTVKKILYHSVFAKLDEYENLEGMIHISEIAPGRIRNIRDYVKEDKKLVCKVLRINKEKGHIDLSLRRVNQSQRLNKSSDFKQETKAEKLLEMIGKEIDKDLPTMYKEVGFSLIETYGSLNIAFQSMALDDEQIKKFKLSKKLESRLLEVIKSKIKTPEIEVKGILELNSEAQNGVEIVKNILLKIQKGTIKVTYISAPRYKIQVTASDFKTAEGLIKQAQEDAIKEIEEAGGTGSFLKLK